MRGDLLGTHDSLQAFCDRARAEGAIAIDLEFQRERTYWAKLCLVQAATRDEARIVDPLARDTDLSPFLELMADPAVEVVLHSGGQDMEILYRRALRPPRNVFDTQIAAAKRTARANRFIEFPLTPASHPPGTDALSPRDREV